MYLSRFSTMTETEWRCTPQASYGILGWIETIIKSLAFVTAVVAMQTFILPINPISLSAPRVAQVVIFGAFVGWHIFQIVHRFLVGELFAVAFAFVQVIGAFFIFLVSLATLGPGGYIFAYAFLMLLGHIVALMFLSLREDLEVRLLHKPALIGINIIQTVAYFAILIIQVVIWLGGYPGDFGR